jgi:hypothetical protein
MSAFCCRPQLTGRQFVDQKMPSTFILTSSTPHVCTIQPAQANSNAIARLVAAGTCAITAKQAGNADYFAATPVEQSFKVRN